MSSKNAQDVEKGVLDRMDRKTGCLNIVLSSVLLPKL